VDFVPRPEYLAVRGHQHHADIEPIPVRIEHDADSKEFTVTNFAMSARKRQVVAGIAVSNDSDQSSVRISSK